MTDAEQREYFRQCQAGWDYLAEERRENEEARKVRARVVAWAGADLELTALKRGTLRGLSEEESAAWFDGLDCLPGEIWRAPARLNGSGLVEQQRLFAKGHAR